MSSNIKLVRESVQATRDHVLPKGSALEKRSGGAAPADQSGSDSAVSGLIPGAYDQAVAKAVQSIAQTSAIAIQDAADMMRNISTVETTAIGVATAKWIANPTNQAYKEIIDKSISMIKDSAKAYGEIGKSVHEVLSLFDV